MVPPPDENTTFGQYRVNPNGFIRALGTTEENLALGSAADEALLSRLQSHRNYDSNSPPESPPTPATPATPPPITTPTPARSRSRTPPPNPYFYCQIPPHPPLLHGRHPLTVLLPRLSLRGWIVPINVLLTDAAFYMVIFGKLHDTGLLHRHRLRLILLRFHHHLPQRLPRELHAAVF